MKDCRHCGEKLSLSGFYRHKQMADGHLNICKECTKQRVCKHRDDNLERVQAYDRRRGRSEERLEANRLRSRAVRASGKGKATEWRKRNPSKYKTHIQVGNRVRDGKLIKKPCSVCGSITRIEAHHPDYTKPLEVVWLCRKHHAEIHRKYQNEESL